MKDFLIGFLMTCLLLMTAVFLADFLTPRISIQSSPDKSENVVFLEKGERFVDLGGRCNAPSIVTEYAPEKLPKTYFVRHNCAFVKPLKIVEQ